MLAFTSIQNENAILMNKNQNQKQHVNDNTFFRINNPITPYLGNKPPYTNFVNEYGQFVDISEDAPFETEILHNKIQPSELIGNLIEMSKQESDQYNIVEMNKNNNVFQYYLGSVTIVGLFVIFRMINKY